MLPATALRALNLSPAMPTTPQTPTPGKSESVQTAPTGLTPDRGNSTKATPNHHHIQ